MNIVPPIGVMAPRKEYADPRMASAYKEPQKTTIPKLKKRQVQRESL